MKFDSLVKKLVSRELTGPDFRKKLWAKIKSDTFTLDECDLAINLLNQVSKLMIDSDNTQLDWEENGPRDDAVIEYMKLLTVLKSLRAKKIFHSIPDGV